LYCRAPHLEPDAAVSSACALYRAWWRPQPRWPTVGGLSGGLLSARPGALPLLSLSLLSLAARGVCAAAPPVLLHPRAARGGRTLRHLSRSPAKCRMGGVC